MWPFHRHQWKLHRYHIQIYDMHTARTGFGTYAGLEYLIYCIKCSKSKLIQERFSSQSLAEMRVEQLKMIYERER